MLSDFLRSETSRHGCPDPKLLWCAFRRRSRNTHSCMSDPTNFWTRIDTVLLDMDGTLLDLRFDNSFGLDLIPREYGKRHGMDEPAARAELAPRFDAHRGTLNWYCTEFWSRELELDVAALKHDAREHIAWLPGAE